jgi:hypothetical protein
MEDYASIISRLNRQVNEFAPKSNISIANNKYSIFEWKSYYIYIIIPILVTVLLLLWRPNFLMYKNEENKKRIKIKHFCITIVVLSTIIIIGYIFYQVKYNN